MASSVDHKIVWRKREVRRETSRAVKAGTELVVCIGGDGMVLQVATALAGSGIPLGIVPTGTGNLLAGNLKLPHAREDAVRTALTGRPRRIDRRADHRRRQTTRASPSPAAWASTPT